MAELERDDELMAVRALRRAARLAPLTDWPHGYTAWVAQLWSQIEAAEVERRLSEMSEVHRG